MTLVSTVIRKARIRRQILKHYGPGAHPGSGTDQTVHDPTPGYDEEDDEGGLFGEEEQAEQGEFADDSAPGLEQTEAGVGAAPGTPLATEGGEATTLGVPDLDPGATDVAYEDAIRPSSLDEFVGQPGVVNQLKVMTQAAREQGRPLDHILFSGPPGLGKTTLAKMMAEEMGANIKIVQAQTINSREGLVSTLMSLQDGDILFIDETHGLSDDVAELLYPAMEDFEIDIPLGQAGTIRRQLPRFTLLGATTEAGSLPSPMLQRFGEPMKLDFYRPEDLAQIVERTSGILGVNFDQSAYMALATRAQGTPRKANNLAKWMRDWAEVYDLETVTSNDVDAALSLRSIDPGGLRKADRQYLSFLASNDHPVGENTIASYLGEAKETIADSMEPYLLRDGYIMRTPRGRVITDKGKAHLEQYGVDWGVEDLEDVYKHYGPGPHKTGTPQSVHGGTMPYWFDDLSLIRSRVRDDPSLAPDVEEWSLRRIDELREEMGKATTEREKKAIGEETHALTTVWATAYNVRTTGYPEGEMPPDVKDQFDRWYEAYHAENLAERERRSKEFTEATESGGVSYIPYHDRITEDDDFLSTLIDTNVPGGQPFVQDVPDIQPGAIVFGPTGPFQVKDKIGPKVGELPSYPPGGEAWRPRGLARPRSRDTAPPVHRPGDLHPDHTRFIGEDATGRLITLDLPYEGIAPPFIPDHRVGDIKRLFQKFQKMMIQKHGNHNQKDHGNWARGTSARQLLEAVESSGEPLSGNRGHTVYVPTGSEPDSGFAVGITERGAKHPSRPSPDQIRDYMNANRDLLDQPGYHLGFWESPEGEWWMDVSQVFDSADEAFEAYPEEEAIFDFSTFESVYNPGLQSDTG